ncbi:MAG: cytochrome c peroxidase [Sulfitobacter sp.]
MRVALVAFCMTLAVGAALAGPLPRPVSDDDYLPAPIEEARLGQLLFYDPILSGNRNIACATCHHPAFGTADGLALGLGEGAIGLGSTRRSDPAHPPEKRIPRNAPALFNLGAREFTVMFHDGRLEADPASDSGMRTPMDADMVSGFASVLSAQTMFPVISRDEMAGSHRENDIGRAVRQGIITGQGGAWDLIARRVADIPAYAAAFEKIYPHVTNPDDIAFTDISNAIAVFMAFEWRSDAAPFDAFLSGEQSPEGQVKRGMDLFYGDASCASCHAGPFLTDHKFHAAGIPQIGPGKTATFETHTRDEGRFGVTGNIADLYAFRTPSLRNVALTAPYGHAGAHRTLAAFLADHADPVPALERFDLSQVVLPLLDADDFTIMADPVQRGAIAKSVTLKPVPLSEDDIADLVVFLNALTDPNATQGRLGVPDSVPSGLPVPNPE